MKSYLLKYEHVPLVEIDGRKVVIDTGSPLTFDLAAGSGAESDDSFSARVRQTVVHQTGERPDALWGTDVLGSQTLRFDLPRREVVLGGAPGSSSTNAKILKSDTFGGLPVVHVLVAGNPKRLVLDTGCHHGYLLDVGGLKPTGTNIEDHSPLVSGGQFHAPKFRGEMNLLTEDEEVISLGISDFGYVRDVDGICKTLVQFGLDGVVGGNVFRKKVIEFSNGMQTLAVVG